VKLHAENISAPDDGGQFAAVVDRGQRVAAQRAGETVHEVKPVALGQVREQRILASYRQGVPAHVRYRQAGGGRQARDAACQHAKTARVALGRVFEQQLHA